MLTYNVKGKKSLERLLKKWGFKSVVRAARKVMNYHTVLLVSEIRTEDLSGPTTKKTVSARSGRLRQNIKAKRARVIGRASIQAGVTAGTAYAGVHIGRRGKRTTIRPKNAQYLTIPLDAAKTKAGVARGSARSGVFGETFVVKSKAGNLIIMGKRKRQRGKSAGQTFGNVVPLFVLKKKVVIRARVDPRKRTKKVQRVIGRDIIKELQRGG